MAKLTEQTKSLLLAAVNLVRQSETGRRYGDLVTLLKVKFPMLTASQIRGAVWNLDQRCSMAIEKPETGLFRFKKNGEYADTLTLPEAVAVSIPTAEQEEEIVKEVVTGIKASMMGDLTGTSSAELVEKVKALQDEIDLLPEGTRGSTAGIALGRVVDEIWRRKAGGLVVGEELVWTNGVQYVVESVSDIRVTMRPTKRVTREVTPFEGQTKTFDAPARSISVDPSQVNRSMVVKRV